MSTIRCPVCRRPLDPDATPTAPFCSQRCREIDLARWLDERYTVSVPRSVDDEEDYDEETL